ncbi:hypothetical protein ACFQ1R_11145 [Mariniflexile jejuense]|uniref:YD repeat-containing protein n=1 Tax=Mariniflexile jejuense TaxID=1173582 RepID=A0ABW3JKJ9_9FLAO
MKIIIKSILIVLFFTSYKNPPTTGQISDHAPMNPVIGFFHKEDLALKGPVKMAGDDYFDKNGNVIKSMTDVFTHSNTKITMKTGDILYTYLKNNKEQIIEMTISGKDESTFFTYNNSGLLETEYGIENGISYKTIYDYDINGRIKQYTYIYGNDPIQIHYYNYKELKNNTLEITITFNNSEQKEIYHYKNGIMVASTYNGTTSTYSYKFDKQGNWTTQTTDSGSFTKRTVKYY